MAKKNKYTDWPKEDLVKRIDALERRKKYGLVWDEERTKEKFQVDAEGKLPVLKEVKSKEIKTDSAKPTHILIEGDNYHALSALNYTHEKAIDLIYIDPPYNTGNKTWKYNNSFVERDDAFRHSKWLTFMEKRLRLSKNLLKKDGIIIVAIDDYEVFQLGLLLDEIFGEQNRLAAITVLNKKSGRTTDKFFSTCHEYYLVYARDVSFASITMFNLDEDDIAEYKYQDDISRYKWRDFLRTGGFSTPEERPNSYYPIYYCEINGEISVTKIPRAVKIWPIDSKGNKRVWRQTRPSLANLIDEGDIKIEKNERDKYTVRIKDRIKTGLKPKTVWDNPKYDAASHGTKLLESILGKARMFDFPKSVHAVIDSLKITVAQKKNAIILDYFAGSGTTGHAVLALNKLDNENRQFILCTNDENGICSEVCYPRLQKVIKGYRNAKGKSIDKLGGNLKYYRTSFVQSEPTDRNKELLTKEAVEMLCLRESTFDLVSETETFKIYRNKEHYTGIIFDQLSIPKFKKAASKYDKPVSVYIFSLGDDDFSDEFAGMKKTIKVCPIPEAILRVYRRIFK